MIHKNFSDEMYKKVNAMEVTSIEKVELSVYQLEDVAQILFTP